MDKLEFPIEGHSVCPNCGGAEKIGRAFIDELIADKKLPEGTFREGLAISIPFTQVLQSALAMPVPAFPVLQICFEICGNSECHTFYITKIILSQQDVQVQMKQQGPPGGLPGQRKMKPHFLTG